MQKTAAFAAVFSLSRNLFFDRRPEGKKADKTSKPNPSAYKGTVGFSLRSKSKCLAQQAFYTTSVKIKDFATFSSEEKALFSIISVLRILTVVSFFDTLKNRCFRSGFIAYSESFGASTGTRPATSDTGKAKAMPLAFFAISICL